MPAPLLDGDSLRRPDNRSSSRSVREALGLGEGDHVVFRVEGHRAARFHPKP
jgi:hypothetical protein